MRLDLRVIFRITKGTTWTIVSNIEEEEGVDEVNELTVFIIFYFIIFKG